MKSIVLALFIIATSSQAFAKRAECVAAYKGVKVSKAIQDGRISVVIDDKTLNLGEKQYFLEVSSDRNGVAKAILTTFKKIALCNNGESKCYDYVSSKTKEINLTDNFLVGFSVEDIFVVCQNMF